MGRYLLITIKLLLGFNTANCIVCVTLIDCWDSTKLLVVIHMISAVRYNDRFYKRMRKQWE